MYTLVEFSKPKKPSILNNNHPFYKSRASSILAGGVIGHAARELPLAIRGKPNSLKGAGLAIGAGSLLGGTVGHSIRNRLSKSFGRKRRR